MLDWENLPKMMQKAEVRAYYEIMCLKKKSLIFKRIFDFVASFVLSLTLLPIILIIFAAIKMDSKGPAFFLQKRVTIYGKKFNILKFRTMYVRNDQGNSLTMKGDLRITRVGNFLRRFRLDEIPQLFNILTGDMTFVGTRPEVPEYVEKYAPEMLATLLLPAGVTGNSSIKFKDEDKILSASNNYEKTYIEEILPKKMKYNLEYLKNFSFWEDIKIMFRTLLCVL